MVQRGAAKTAERTFCLYVGECWQFNGNGSYGTPDAGVMNGLSLTLDAQFYEYMVGGLSDGVGFKVSCCICGTVWGSWGHGMYHTMI